MVLQPVPELCDDILLHIFANLDLRDLTSVAQCNSRFFGLAQYTFEVSFNSCLDAGPNPVHDGDDARDHDDVEILEMFGISAKHSGEYRMPDNPWPYLSIGDLQSLRFDVSDHRLPVYFKHLRNQRQRFDALESLEFCHDYVNANGKKDKFTKVSIDFNYWFPNLKSLRLDGGQYLNYVEKLLPRTLEKLDFGMASGVRGQACEKLIKLNPRLIDLRIDYPTGAFDADILGLLIDCGLHRTLQKLQFKDNIHSDDESLELVTQLGNFEQLNELRISYGCCGSLAGLADMLRDINQLKVFHIALKQRTKIEIEEFLLSLASNAPPNLEEFCLHHHSVVQLSDDAWQRFVTAMPTVACSRIECDDDDVCDEKLMQIHINEFVRFVLNAIERTFSDFESDSDSDSDSELDTDSDTDPDTDSDESDEVV